MNEIKLQCTVCEHRLIGAMYIKALSKHEKMHYHHINYAL